MEGECLLALEVKIISEGRWMLPIKKPMKSITFQFQKFCVASRVAQLKFSTEFYSHQKEFLHVSILWQLSFLRLSGTGNAMPRSNQNGR